MPRIFHWAALGALFGWGVGGVSYSLAVHLLGPQRLGATWPGWDLLFYGLVVALPILCAAFMAWRAAQRHE